MTARILILAALDAVLVAGLAWGWDVGAIFGLLAAVLGATAAVLVRNHRDLNELYGAKPVARPPARGTRRRGR